MRELKYSDPRVCGCALHHERAKHVAFAIDNGDRRLEPACFSLRYRLRDYGLDVVLSQTGNRSRADVDVDNWRLGPVRIDNSHIQSSLNVARAQPGDYDLCLSLDLEPCV